MYWSSFSGVPNFKGMANLDAEEIIQILVQCHIRTQYFTFYFSTIWINRWITNILYIFAKLISFRFHCWRFETYCPSQKAPDKGIRMFTHTCINVIMSIRLNIILNKDCIRGLALLKFNIRSNQPLYLTPP